jgi:hypothetical protein
MPDEFKLRLEDELEVIMSCYEEENVHITSKGPVTLVTVYLPGPDFKADMPSYLPISATVHLPPMYMQQTTPAPLCTFSYRAMTNPVSPLVPLLDGWLGEEREREARVQLVSFYTAAGPTGGEVLFDFFEWVRQWLPYPSESLRSETAVAKQEGASPPAATAAATSASAVAPAAIAAPRPPSWKELWTAGGVFIGPKELIQKSRFAVFVVPVQTAQEVRFPFAPSYNCGQSLIPFLHCSRSALFVLFFFLLRRSALWPCCCRIRTWARRRTTCGPTG